MRKHSDVEERSRRPADGSECFETVIIGGGQAGLSRSGTTWRGEIGRS